MLATLPPEHFQRRRPTAGRFTVATARKKKETDIVAGADGDLETTQSANASAVARRAYDLYLARGREDGRDVEDWLQAERELRAAATSATA
jgi:hypothetical protein